MGNEMKYYHVSYLETKRSVGASRGEISEHKSSAICKHPYLWRKDVIADEEEKVESMIQSIIGKDDIGEESREDAIEVVRDAIPKVSIVSWQEISKEEYDLWHGRPACDSKAKINSKRRVS